LDNIKRANDDKKNVGAKFKLNNELAVGSYSETNETIKSFSHFVETCTRERRDADGGNSSSWLDRIITQLFVYSFDTGVFGDKRLGSSVNYDEAGNSTVIYLQSFNVSTKNTYNGSELYNFPLNYPYHHNRYEKDEKKYNKPTTDTKPSVFVFTKYMPNEESQISMRIIELTDYLIDVETSLTHLGGTFSIKLAHKPIMNIYGEESSEIYRGKDLSKIQGGYKEMTLYDDEIDKELRIRGFNFNVSENDIVFICKKQFSVDTKYNPLDIPIDFFWNNVSSFYMIGLIDASSSITDYKNSNIVLSGRDLSKLLIEDGTYWYQYSVSSGENNIFQNGNDSKGGDEAGIFKDNKDENGKTLQERMFLSGLIMQLTNFEEKSILGVMQIFINTLSNVQICPDNVITDKFNIM
jgi:hypothetical protein